MKTIPWMTLIAMLAASAIFAETGKLSDVEFTRLAGRHETAEAHQRLATHYAAHAAEAAAALPNLAQIHQDLAKQDAGKK